LLKRIRTRQINGPAWPGSAWLGPSWLGSAWLGLAWLGLANFTGVVLAGILFSRNFRKSEICLNFFLVLSGLSCIFINTDRQFCPSVPTIKTNYIMNKATHEVIYRLSYGGCAIVPAHKAAKFAQEFSRSGDEPDMYGYFLKKGSSQVTILIHRHADFETFSRPEADYTEIGTALRANTWRHYV
jgi:hypothetical protein